MRVMQALLEEEQQWTLTLLEAIGVIGREE